MSTLPDDASRLTGAGQTTSMVATAPRLPQIADAVRQFMAMADELGVSRPPEMELRDVCRSVAEATAALFPGGLGVHVDRDREIPDDIYFVFDVGASGQVEDILALDKEWHRRLHRVAGRFAELFCLSCGVH